MVKTSLLSSDYIIDGIRMDATPRQMLEIACGNTRDTLDEGFECFVDESEDPLPEGPFSKDSLPEYAAATADAERTELPLAHIRSYTKRLVAQSLVDAIWRDGHFRLNDLQIAPDWKWNPSAIGGPSAFFRSVESCCDYLDSLGVMMDRYSAEENSADSLSATVSLSDNGGAGEENDFFDELPFRTEHPKMSDGRRCPEKAAGTEEDWLVYIPFDTCAPRLGGSLLSDVTGISGGMSPAISDPDYFIDCYEVVREMVEDGIITAGATVGEGGLMSALARMLPEGTGIEAGLEGIAASYGENDPVRIMFAEIPGVIIEIKDADYDYLDAELLLQDVAFYPIGHVSRSFTGIRTCMDGAGGISGILRSLLSSGASEGED